MLQNLFKETQNSYKKMQNYFKKTKQNKAPKIQRTFQLWVKYRKRRVRAFVDRMLPISTRLFAVLI